MSASTVYDVRIRYLMDDMASGKTLELDRNLRQAAGSSSALESGFKKLAAAAAGYFGLHEAKRAFIDFNSNMEQAKITMGGMLMNTQGGAFVDNLEKANDLVGKLQMRAKASVGTTADMVEMASRIAQPVSDAGASMKQLEDMTVAAVVGAKAFNVESGAAARDIDQALRGQFHSVDVFTGKALGAIGYKGETGRAQFNALAPQKRLSELMRATAGSESIKAMAKAQEVSFAGVFSTLQDNIQMTLGKVGMPLFQEITAELASWNAWIDKNGDRLEEIGRTVGHALVEGFRDLKRITEFLLDHWREIAGIFAAVKVSSAMGAAGGALSGGPLGSMGSAMIGAAGKLNLLASAAGVAYLALDAIGQHYMDKVEQREQFKAVSQGSAFRAFSAMRGVSGDVSGLSGAAIDQTVTALKQSGVLNIGKKGYGFDKSRMQQILGNADYDTRDEMATMLGGDAAKQYAQMRRINPVAPEEHAKFLADAMGERLSQIFQMHPELINPADPFAKKFDDKKVQPAAPIKVTINRIEVQSDDPDRFAFQFSKIVSDAARNRSAARGVIRE